MTAAPELTIVDPTERLISSLVKTVLHLPPPTWRRVRFSVSPEEYEAIRGYMFARDGVFYGRIKGVPLIIDDDPTMPALVMEIRQTATANQDPT